MNEELQEEINYILNTLTKSGFYNEEEILEILEEQFIEENIDFNNITIEIENNKNSNFALLEKTFKKLAKEDIISIHNCGYDMEEGVADAFELFLHLKNNKFNPKGFCFYTFEDIEEAILNENLKITFGDFDNNENKALEIGKTIADALKSFNFNINWDETINNQIEINPFLWDKSYNESIDYAIEGAFDEFKNTH